jgi:hypothetical protein
VQWQRTFGSSLFDWGHHVVQTSDDGYILAGTTSFGLGFLGGGWGYDLWVLKLDSQGNIQWQKTYGGRSYDDVGIVQQTSHRDKSEIVPTYYCITTHKEFL